ncbi:MAG TPA: serine/threonine-protein kinase, partial [Polyangiaceae bacterium]|nr:serine/threonine-protein kinase [Polyangiaceae bacterium]
AFDRNPKKRFDDPIALANAFIEAAGGLPARSSHRHADRTPRVGSLGDAPTLTPSAEFPARASREMSPGRLGKYQLVAELGHGGMADVYLAVAQGPAGFGFSKLMVIKRLRPSLANDSDFVSMIVDEARLAARLNHPNVVQTLEVGRVGKHYFIAMEYLDGQPFDRLLNRAHRQDGGIRKDLGYVVVSDVLAGLHHAHELRDYDGEPLNVVHRDVSPHNVFITYDGQVKVVDFGIARAAKRATHTATGVVKGKVFYMAPEQARGTALDRRADIFSAGILLWEIAAGRRMWADKDDVVVMHQLTSGGFSASPKEIAPDVPEAIDTICKKALAREPEDRYATAAAMQADLDRVIHEMRAKMAHGNANHELGEYIADLFADDRHDIQGKIEHQMKALAEATHPELIEAVQISRKITPSADQEAPTELHDAADAESSHSSDAPMTATPGLSPSNRRLWFAAAAAVVVVGAVALAFNKDDAQPQTPVQPSAPVQASAAPEPSSPNEETVRVRVSVTPSDAIVTLDGKRLDGNPFDARMQRDDRTHTLTVEAPGHKTESHTISLARDVELDIELRSTSRGPRTAKTPAPQPSAKGVGVKTTRTIDTSDPYKGGGVDAKHEP